MTRLGRFAAAADVREGHQLLAAVGVDEIGDRIDGPHAALPWPDRNFELPARKLLQVNLQQRGNSLEA